MITAAGAGSAAAIAINADLVSDDLATADLLIGAGAQVNTANDYGITPLLLASENGSAAMIEKLLKAGAKPNTAKPTGETALMIAARTGKPGAVQALLVQGADVNAKEPSLGQTALMWAAAQGHSEVVQLLAAQVTVSLENARLYADLEARDYRIRRIFEVDVIGIVFWDLNGQLLDANDAFLGRVANPERALPHSRGWPGARGRRV